MANLQVNLRSQYALAVNDLPRLLTSVNRLLYESTDDASYATRFFADYDDSGRKLRYANCGHLSPLLLRGGSSHELSEARKVDWLHSTCTVLGLFEAWRCEIAEVELAPGDTLYSTPMASPKPRMRKGKSLASPICWTHLRVTLTFRWATPPGCCCGGPAIQQRKRTAG